MNTAGMMNLMIKYVQVTEIYSRVFVIVVVVFEVVVVVVMEPLLLADCTVRE
jgi:hypothetical protein